VELPTKQRLCVRGALGFLDCYYLTKCIPRKTERIMMKLDIKTKSKLYKLSEVVHKLKVKSINKKNITFKDLSDVSHRVDLIIDILKNEEAR
jgi:hypothetical protein